MTDYSPIQQEVINGITNVYDIITDIMDFCVKCGWTIHDDQTSETHKYFIVKSSDNSKDYRESPCYAGIKVFSTQQYYLRTFIFLYWDEVAHSYNGLRGPNVTNAWTGTGTQDDWYKASSVLFSSSGVNTLTMYGNEYFLSFVVYRGSDSKRYGSIFYKYMYSGYDYKFKTLNDIEKGSNREIQLEENQADKFKINDSLWLLCKDAHTYSKVKVNSIDTVNDTIIADEIYWTTVSGSYLGGSVAVYPWAVKVDAYDQNWPFYAYYYQLLMNFRDGNVNTYYKSTGYYYGQSDATSYWFPSDSTSTYLANMGKRVSINDRLFGEGSEVFGYNDYIKSGPGSVDDTLGYNRSYMGTATSGTDDTLIDLSKSWSEDEIKDKCVIVTGGQAAGDVLHITYNNSSSVTISGSFSAVPDTTSEYGIYDEGYVKIDNTDIYGYSYLLRIA